MIPEENPVEVEATIRRVIEQAAAERSGISVNIKRLLLANAMTPLAGNQPLVDAIQKHAQAVLGELVPAVGTPLYTDVRLYVERGIPGVIYAPAHARCSNHTPSGPMSGWTWKTCAAPPRLSRGR